jgi:hypothetical protein
MASAKAYRHLGLRPKTGLSDLFQQAPAEDASGG